MPTVTVHSDFGAQENKIWNYFHFPSSICHEVMGLDAMILVFWMLSFKPTFSLSSFTFIKRLFSSSSLSAIGRCHLHIWGYWYFYWQSWFLLVLHQAQGFSWCTLHMLNKQGDSIQPWCTPFPIWNQSGSKCSMLVLTVASWPAYWFLRRQVRWSGIPISLRISRDCCGPHSQRLWHSQ